MAGAAVLVTFVAAQGRATRGAGALLVVAYVAMALGYLAVGDR
jgi:Ca2+/H+ antiporter